MAIPSPPSNSKTPKSLFNGEIFRRRLIPKIELDNKQICTVNN